MIYSFSLQAMALVAGAVLCLFGALGFSAPATSVARARSFPRSRWAGIILLAIDLVWSLWLLATMEMGEFSVFRRPLLIALPIAFFLAIRFVEEFLAVRALGIFLLLAAEPLLSAAFFRYEKSRLVLTVLAYIIIVLGLIWVMIPYKMRDYLDWLGNLLGRWRALNALIFIYGAVLLILALVAY